MCAAFKMAASRSSVCTSSATLSSDNALRTSNVKNKLTGCSSFLCQITQEAPMMLLPNPK